MNWNFTLSFFEKCDTTLCFDPSPPMSHFITYLIKLRELSSLPYSVWIVLFEWPLSVLYNNIAWFSFLWTYPDHFTYFCKCFNRILRGINFRGYELCINFAGIKFRSCLKEQFFPWPYFVVLRNQYFFTWTKQSSRENVVQKTVYQRKNLIFVHQFSKSWFSRFNSLGGQ